MQGYERSQITVLTMYSGQLLQIKRIMPKEFFKGVRISAVDNFQGSFTQDKFPVQLVIWDSVGSWPAFLRGGWGGGKQDYQKLFGQ